MLLFLLIFKLHAAGPFVLTENSLIEQFKKELPTIEKILANENQKQINYLQLKEKFSPYIDASADYLNSDEKSFISYIPTTEKSLTKKIGVVSPTSYGASFFAHVYSNKMTSTLLKDATTTGLVFGLGLDLYKDFLGRSSRNLLKSKKTAEKRAALEKEIQLQGLYTNIKKIYWSLVANAESLKISKQLFQSSDEQLKYAQKRLKNGVADQGEVARYEAQLAQRRSQIISFEYQRSHLFKSLKQYLTPLSNQEIIVGEYDVEKSIQSVLNCSTKIKAFESAPLQYTYLDEITKLLKEEQALDEKISSLYDQTDIKLTAKLDTMGKDYSESKSIDDLKDDTRRNIGIGLSIQIPFGGDKESTKEKIIKAQKRHYTAQKLENLGKINAFHDETLKAVDYLREVIKNQKKNTFFLSKSLEVSKKKYNQARIAVEQLVQEQDLLLKSNLDEIRSDLEVVHTLLDYFSVFVDMPCELNRNVL